jgi:hypothetical protein
LPIDGKRMEEKGERLKVYFLQLFFLSFPLSFFLFELRAQMWYNVDK